MRTHVSTLLEFSDHMLNEMPRILFGLTGEMSEENSHPAYANASVSAIINANTPEEAKQAFCAPGDTYTILLESGVEANIEIDRGVDIGKAESIESAEQTTDPITDKTEQRVDPHSTDPTIADIVEIVNSKLSSDEYSISKLDGVVSLQLHNDGKTDAIAAALIRSDYSFRVSQVFECPPQFKIRKQISPP